MTTVAETILQELEARLVVGGVVVRRIHPSAVSGDECPVLVLNDEAQPDPVEIKNQQVKWSQRVEVYALAAGDSALGSADEMLGAAYAAVMEKALPSGGLVNPADAPDMERAAIGAGLVARAVAFTVTYQTARRDIRELVL